MKFTCSQQVLSKALNTVSKAVSTRTTIPILKGILINAHDIGSVTFSASDLDISIEKNIEANIETSGSIVVNSKLFGDIIRKLPNEQVLIEENNNQVTIKTSSSEFTISGLSSEEFAEVGKIQEGKETLTFNTNLFKNMIKRTSFAASIDESKGIIIGVLIELEPDSVNMAALDGFRMAVTRESITNTNHKNIVISAKILNDINKIISESEDEGDIQFLLDDKQAIVLVEETKIVLRLLEGEFIKYKDILPTQNQTNLLIEKSVLLNSIERASLLAKEGKNNLIKFIIKNNLLTITSRSEEGALKEEIIMEKTGEDLEIGFNSKYIIDVLKAIDDDTIKLEFNTSVTPCIIKPIEGNYFEYLILPVRIS